MQGMVSSVHDIDLTWPGWCDHREAIQQLQCWHGGTNGLPTAETLQRLLPANTINHRGEPIQFRSGTELAEVDYEAHIYRTGEVPTREDNWHDVFNALAWVRFPRLKSAMNAIHCREKLQHASPGRGPVRDALTLFDECGVLLLSSASELLGALAQRDWRSAFVQQGSAWQTNVRLFVCGHALLEKFLRPYKAITAHAVLLPLTAAQLALPRAHLLRQLDAQMAEAVLSGRRFRATTELAPVPLMGIPGWWTNSVQDDAFYSDQLIFRPSRPARSLSG